MSAEPAPEPRDATEVGFAAARTAWAEAARPVLLEAAGRYRALVHWKDLSAAVQESTGITTGQPVAKWIGDVLARVAADCASREEPLLSSLCVSVQGGVGEQYAETVERVRGERPDDPDGHAAEERLRCYRHWEAAGLPRDGGTALRTAHFKPARRTAAARPAARATSPRSTGTRPAPARTPAPEPKPIRLCPTCFTEVPASGICDYCD